MLLNVDRDQLIVQLDDIMYTSTDIKITNKASDMSLTITRLPLRCSTVTLSEEDALFIIDNSK